MRVAILYRLCVANTTNLFYHLQINHPEEHKEVIIKKKGGDSAGKETRELDSTRLLDDFLHNKSTVNTQRSTHSARMRL